MADATVKLTIHLFGAPEARLAGAPLVLHHQKARALLYYLAATGRPHTRDHLATLLWSESPESNALAQSGGTGELPAWHAALAAFDVRVPRVASPTHRHNSAIRRGALLPTETKYIFFA